MIFVKKINLDVMHSGMAVDSLRRKNMNVSCLINYTVVEMGHHDYGQIKVININSMPTHGMPSFDLEYACVDRLYHLFYTGINEVWLFTLRMRRLVA
jgi:hypothetical protein